MNGLIALARRLVRVVPAAATLVVLSACGGAAAPTPAAPATSAAVSAKPASAPAATKPAPSTAAAPRKPAASAAAKPAISSPASAGAKLPSLTVAYLTNTSASFSPLWLADATNAFTKRGVSVTLKLIGSPAMTPALVSKDVDIVAASAAPVLTADLNGQLDEAYIGAILSTNTVSLFGAKDVKSGADLKGKTVGTDRPGTPTDFFVRQLLTKLGLKASDVVLRPLGGSDVTTPAFVAGQLAATNAGPPITFQLQKQGYPMLADTYGMPYLAQGYVILRSRANELAPALPGFLAGIRDGIHVFNEQPDLTKRILQQYSKESDPDVLQQTYDFYRTTAKFDTSLQPNRDSLQAMIDYLGETLIPAAREAKPDQFIEPRFIAQVPKD